MTSGSGVKALLGDQPAASVADPVGSLLDRREGPIHVLQHRLEFPRGPDPVQTIDRFGRSVPDPLAEGHGGVRITLDGGDDAEL